MRPSVYSKADGKGVVKQSFLAGDRGVYSRWPIDSFVQRFDLGACLIGFVLLSYVNWDLPWPRAGFAIGSSETAIGFSSLILLTAASALVAKFRDPIFTNRFYLQYLVLAVLYTGAFALFCWIAV